MSAPLFDIPPEVHPVSDLQPGSILHSGHVVASVATGGRLYGPAFLVTFTDGRVSHVGGANRVLVRSL